MIATQIHDGMKITQKPGGFPNEHTIEYRGIVAEFDRIDGQWYINVSDACHPLDDLLERTPKFAGRSLDDVRREWKNLIDTLFSRLAALLARAGEPVSANGGVQVVSVAPPPSVTAWVGSTLAIGQGGGQ